MTIKPKNSKALNRTKTIAATVAALGATIGVSMGDVLVGAADLKVIETDKAAITSQKIKKPDVRSPKVERPELKNRPDLEAVKIQRPGLKNRPGVRADKSSAILEKQPGVISDKVGK